MYRENSARYQAIVFTQWAGVVALPRTSRVPSNNWTFVGRIVQWAELSLSKSLLFSDSQDDSQAGERLRMLADIHGILRLNTEREWRAVDDHGR